MKLPHPFTWLSPPAQRRAFPLFLILTALMIVAMQLSGAPLKTEAAPMGIVSFEFAGSVTNARLMMDAWGPEGRVYAGLNMGLDFLFLVAYALTIALGCVLMGRRLSPARPSRVAGLVAWGVLLAGVLDAVENGALIQLLFGSDNALWPPLAYGCAAVKFGLVALGLLYFFLGGAFSLVKKRGAA